MKFTDIPQASLVRIATVIDCEGCIGIIKSPPRNAQVSPVYNVRISLAMTQPFYVMMFAELFGGKIRTRQGRGKNWKPQFECVIGGTKAENCLMAIRPYLCLKIKQCQVGLDFLRYRELIRGSWGPFRFMPDEAVAKYEELYQESRRLNQRGPKEKNFVKAA